MARLVRPSLQVIDFVGGLRLEGRDGSRDLFFASMARVMVLSRVGARCHTREGGRWWWTQLIP